ncbi:MAG: DNA-binding response regulator [Phenylobacterium zucineum]|nr:MAG: DNA-binding response regulator [Phenylobacterium zucineum]
MRIAILEDDEAQAVAVSGLLSDAGHNCSAFRTSQLLMKALRRDTFDLLLLDWNLPDLSGIEMIAWVRENNAAPPPILLLTSRSDEADVVTGLNAGADDYVIKPAPGSVLLARVAALLRRAYPDHSAGGVEEFDGYRFDVPAGVLTVDGEVLALTAKEFGLAHMLFRNTHRALSRTHLLEAVWGRNPDLPSRTLDMHISRIRSKLRLRPENGFRLTPVYSYGYRLERLTAAGVAAALS